MISYWLHSNPARQKFFNPWEPHTGSSSKGAEHFTGDHPHDKWASAAAAIDKISKNFAPRCREAIEFYHRHRAPRDIIAKECSVSIRTVSRWLERFHEELSREAARRELIPPLEESQGESDSQKTPLKLAGINQNP